jgi:hypothetical protein
MRSTASREPDRHRYRDEKRDALAKLAALLDGIVNPRDNVVPIRGTAESAV